MNKLRQFICASIVSLYSLSSLAASLQVAPISVAFSPQEKAKEIWLTNTSERPIRAQTRVLIWSQVAGQDQILHETWLPAHRLQKLKRVSNS